MDDHSILKYLMGKEVFVTTSSEVKFSYISNPNGTVRWLYPRKLKSPYFLNFYSIASYRAKFVSTIIKLAFRLKQSDRVKSGEMKLNIASDSRLGLILNKYQNGDFSIFTGTVGENRKAVIEIHNEKEVIVFVKIALTDVAKVLVRNEAKCLEYLNGFSYKKLLIPKLLSNNKEDTIGLSNIKPKKFQQNSTLKEIHIDALSELYSKSNNKLKWNKIRTLSESRINIKELLFDFKVINNLDKDKIEKLANKILLLIDMLEEDNADVTVSIAHCDFTPWNMYNTDNVLHLFDWELSQNNIPLLFDLFHFTFQSEIMIKQNKYTKVVSKINTFLKMKSTKALIDNYDININKNYIFYLVNNIVYYLHKYIKQKDLHQQVFWLIDVWIDAVDDIVKKKGNIFK